MFIDKKDSRAQSAAMHLITMAHLGEAQGVIQLFALKRVTQDLFENEFLTLLLTGEGPFEAATKTALQLGKKSFSQVINLGIAGALKNLEVGSLHEVRTHYLVIEGKPQFKSFSSGPHGLDCLTTFERILNPQKAQALQGLGVLVDREGWGVAYAAKLGGIPYQSFKVVSDLAGTLGACELIKEEAFHFSLKLAQHLQILLQKTTETKTQVLPTGFHFTFTTHHQFQNLLNKLALKEEKTNEEVLALLPWNECREQHSLPKERTKKLLSWMEHKLDPVKHQVQEQIENWQRPFSKQGIELQIDSQWENEKVRVSFDINSDLELETKLGSLKTLSVKPYHDLLAGNFHVE